LNQAEFTGVFCARPQNFAWFLGAGSSRTAGLPTATDILWDIKRRYYCREENQELSRQDVQIPAVRERIQSFMDSRGFPPEGSPDEYPSYFERIFGQDKQRQRRYLKAILSEEHVTLSVGNRVLGALLATSSRVPGSHVGGKVAGSNPAAVLQMPRWCGVAAASFDSPMAKVSRAGMRSASRGRAAAQKGPPKGGLLLCMTRPITAQFAQCFRIATS
jgi:hypothetical protein